MKKILIFIGIFITTSIVCASFSNCTNNDENSGEDPLNKKLEKLINEVNCYEGVNVDMKILEKISDNAKQDYLSVLEQALNILNKKGVLKKSTKSVFDDTASIDTLIGVYNFEWKGNRVVSDEYLDAIDVWISIYGFADEGCIIGAIGDVSVSTSYVSWINSSYTIEGCDTFTTYDFYGQFDHAGNLSAPLHIEGQFDVAISAE